MSKTSAAVLSALLIPAVSQAVVTVDGSRDVEYGGALAVQTVETGFGNNSSEWNAGYARIEGGNLYIMLTGNLEANFNRLEIFIDSKGGGQTVFDSSGNDNANRMDGLTFDLGFTADFHLNLRRGTDLGNNRFDLDFANLAAQTASGYFDIMTGSGTDGIGTTGTGVNLAPILVGYDNSNNAGIGGTAGAAADQAAALAVSTGMELSISLADLGYLGGDINIMVGQNGGGHDYWSNQFLGGLPVGSGNLGGDGLGNFTGEGAIDFTAIAGNQFFTLPVPEPSGLTLFAGGVLLLAARRRRNRTEMCGT